MQYYIFDMDGVLIHSEPIIMKAAEDALALYGIKAGREDFLPYIGAGEEKFISGPAAAAGKEAEIPAIMAEMYRRYRENVYTGLAVFPGAAGTVRELQKQGKTLALVSSSEREKLMVSLDAAGIDETCFTVILSGSDVARKKPDPEPYRKAAEMLGAAAEDCVVIEDALSGVRAAKGAGMACVAVTNSFSKEALLAAGADRCVGNLDELLQELL